MCATCEFVVREIGRSGINSIPPTFLFGAIECAARKGNVGRATWLIGEAAQLCYKSDCMYGENCHPLLDAAAIGGKAETVEALLETRYASQINRKNTKKSSLWLAANLGREEAALALIEGGAYAQFPGVLLVAVQRCRLGLVLVLLDKGANPDQSVAQRM